MLSILLKDRVNAIIDFSDIWFDMNIGLIDFDDIEVQRIMKVIDNVSYAGDFKFFSKFKKDTQVDVTELSTGCKTAINIYSFPNKTFNLAGCGNNALETILNFKNGNVYVQYFIYPKDLNNTVNVLVGDKKIKVNSSKQLHDIIHETFS